jgi:hypothetical protein
VHPPLKKEVWLQQAVDKYEIGWQKRRARLERLDRTQGMQNTIFNLAENVLDNLRSVEVMRRSVPMSLTQLQESFDWHKRLEIEWESMEVACKSKSWNPVKHLEKGRLSGSDKRQARAIEKADQESNRRRSTTSGNGSKKDKRQPSRQSGSSRSRGGDRREWFYCSTHGNNPTHGTSTCSSRNRGSNNNYPRPVPAEGGGGSGRSGAPKL